VVGDINRSLWLAIAAGGGVAVVLTVAARRMERGDLSQRVHVDSKDEIGELAHAFNAMADGLQRQEQLRRNMVTDIAHELRTPLTNLPGYLETRRDGVLAPQPEVVQSLHEDALLLDRLINDLQELTLAEAGQLTLSKQSVSPADLIEEAVAALRPYTEQPGLTLRTAVAPNLPAVNADGERIGQVLRNLIQNARAHTPAGGEIVVAANDLRGLSMIEFSVRDTGSGIAPEHLLYVFERFYRADASRNRATGGAGLGLAIVKQIVEAHGGAVNAESVPGQGSTLSFTLPV
jgi:signal transduction histidine kinase